MIEPVLVTVGKVALLGFIAVGVLILVGTYAWRRTHGVRPWRPPNSRIIGYDATIPTIEHPSGPVYTNGQLPLTDPPQRPSADRAKRQHPQRPRPEPGPGRSNA